MCTTCHHVITKEQKRLQLKNYFTNSAKSGFTTFYEEMFFLASVVQRDLPKLRYLLDSPLTASSLKVYSPFPSFFSFLFFYYLFFLILFISSFLFSFFYIIN